MTVELTHCRAANVEDIMSIGRETYVQTFGAHYPPDVMRSYLDHAFAREVVAGQLQCEQSSVWLLTVDGVSAGYLKLNWGDAQTEGCDETSLEVERIYLLTAFQGQGLGKLLFAHAVAVAKQLSKTSLWLGVWENNTDALNFYRARGGVITGSHAFEMGGVVDQDYIVTFAVEV